MKTMKIPTALLFLVLLIPAAVSAQSVNVRVPVAVGETPQTIKMLRRAIESGVKQADTSGIGNVRIETWVRREGRFFHVKMVMRSPDGETASQERYLVEEAEGRLLRQTKALVLSFSIQRAEALAAAKAAKEAEEERKKQIAAQKAAEAREFLDRWVHGELGFGLLDVSGGGYGGSLELGLLFFDEDDPGFYFGLRPGITLYHTGLLQASLPRINFGWVIDFFDLVGFYLSPVYTFSPDSSEPGSWALEIGWNGFALFGGSGGDLFHRLGLTPFSGLLPDAGRIRVFQYSFVF